MRGGWGGGWGDDFGAGLDSGFSRGMRDYPSRTPRVYPSAGAMNDMSWRRHHGGGGLDPRYSQVLGGPGRAINNPYGGGPLLGVSELRYGMSASPLIQLALHRASQQRRLGGGSMPRRLRPGIRGITGAGIHPMGAAGMGMIGSGMGGGAGRDPANDPLASLRGGPPQQGGSEPEGKKEKKEKK
jgi:hypothetical protein